MTVDLMQVYTLCAGILSLILLGLALHTGTVRSFMDKTFSNPEDAPMNVGKQQTLDLEHTQRWRRTHANAMENILPFLIIGYVLADNVPESTFWAWSFVIFTVFRITHAVSYINKKQPFRTMSFFGGWIVTVMIAVKLILISL